MDPLATPGEALSVPAEEVPTGAALAELALRAMYHIASAAAAAMSPGTKNCFPMGLVRGRSDAYVRSGRSHGLFVYQQVIGERSDSTINHKFIFKHFRLSELKDDLCAEGVIDVIKRGRVAGGVENYPIISALHEGRNVSRRSSVWARLRKDRAGYSCRCAHAGCAYEV